MIANSAQRIGVIDLGSNIARLVILNAVPGYAYRLEDEIREVVRLREGMTKTGLSDTAVACTLFTLRLTLIADEYPAVELWEAERNAASLMEIAFERELILESTAVPDIQFGF